MMSPTPLRLTVAAARILCLFLLPGSVPLAVAGAARSAEPAPRSVVARLYRDYAWEAVLSNSNARQLLQQTRRELERYFTPHLAALIEREHLCAVRNRAPCALDFQPHWNSDAPRAFSLAVAEAATPGEVTVTFSYADDAEPIHLTYLLQRTPRGWRISDLHTERWDLLRILDAAAAPLRPSP
jgi:hypothetical protein